MFYFKSENGRKLDVFLSFDDLSEKKKQNKQQKKTSAICSEVVHKCS